MKIIELLRNGTSIANKGNDTDIDIESNLIDFDVRNGEEIATTLSPS